MSIQIRQVLPDDYPVIELIEDAADQLLVDRFNPDSWRSAPTGSDRATENGWLAILPHPFSPADRAAGYRYDVSVLQVRILPDANARPPGLGTGVL